MSELDESTVLELVRFLNDKGVSLEDVDQEVHGCRGGTALHFATATRNRRLAQLLINMGADVNAVDKLGETPLFRIFYVERDPKDEDGELVIPCWQNVFPLSTIPRLEDLSPARQMFLVLQAKSTERRNVFGMTPLMKAIEMGEQEPWDYIASIFEGVDEEMKIPSEAWKEYILERWVPGLAGIYQVKTMSFHLAHDSTGSMEAISMTKADKVGQG